MRRTTPRLYAFCLTTCGAGLFLLFCRLITVSGGSMEDTLSTGDRVLIVRADIAATHIIARWITRGSVVVATDPMRHGGFIVKRVIALGGDRVRIDGSGVFINGAPLSEPPGVISSGARWPVRHHVLGDQLIPKDHYFLLGDNRAAAVDSRVFGPVGNDRIIGLVLATLRTASKSATAGDTTREARRW